MGVQNSNDHMGVHAHPCVCAFAHMYDRSDMCVFATVCVMDCIFHVVMLRGSAAIADWSTTVSAGGMVLQGEC